MSALAPDLFDRRFPDLLEIGRAKLRSLAPEWTDHNAHDPGITLMELLAWVAEAQVYSLSRVRRDERDAYAALLGLAPTGTQGARGLVWPDPLDRSSPMTTFSRSRVLGEDTVIHVNGLESPTFRPEHRMLFAPGRIERVEARHRGAASIDLTAVNERGDTAFLPFGDRAGRHDVLAITYACNDGAGLFGADDASTAGAPLAIGIIAPPYIGGDLALATAPSTTPARPIVATVVFDDQRFPVRVVSDSTQGLLTTGVLMLDLDSLPSSPTRFTIELRAPSGFARPPRVSRIGLNVVPIRQGRTIARELHVATGMPDWSFLLDVPGLRFGPNEQPVTIEVSIDSSVTTWTRCDRLAACGPRDQMYELDPGAARITFGNSVNGAIPAAGAQVMVTYAVSDAEQGTVARNRQWRVAGFSEVFGTNPDPLTGGAAPSEWRGERRDARRINESEHPMVTSADIEAAVLALPLLEVARAWVVAPASDTPRTGATRLIVVRQRTGTVEPEIAPETQRWLEEIRRRLAPRMPLGTRLVVQAPRYVDFAIDATLESERGRDPTDVQAAVQSMLERRLALVARADGRVVPRPPGVGVTPRDVQAWMRTVDGVRRVIGVRLLNADGGNVPDITVPRGGLPRWLAGRGTIAVVRAASGSAR